VLTFVGFVGAGEIRAQRISAKRLRRGEETAAETAAMAPAYLSIHGVFTTPVRSGQAPTEVDLYAVVRECTNPKRTGGSDWKMVVKVSLKNPCPLKPIMYR
jgi:hypothetical protein